MARRAARDREHALDRRILQTLEQHALADHARRAGDDDLHARKCSRDSGKTPAVLLPALLAFSDITTLPPRKAGVNY